MTWYQDSWLYKKLITIASSNVSGTTDFTNFVIPVMISGDSSIRDHSNGYGDDLIFTNSSQNTILNHELYHYTGGATSVDQDLIAWVNIPTLEYDNDTYIYMYYGNSGVTSGQSHVEETWSDEYTMVLHLGKPYPSTVATWANEAREADIYKLKGGAYLFGFYDDQYDLQVYRSTDEGDTWSWLSEPVTDGRYARFAQFEGDGTVLMGYRSGTAEAYYNMSSSRDSGATFGPGRVIDNASNNYRELELLILTSGTHTGRVVCVGTDLDADTLFTVYSDDSGSTWSSRFTIRDSTADGSTFEGKSLLQTDSGSIILAVEEEFTEGGKSWVRCWKSPCRSGCNWWTSSSKHIIASAQNTTTSTWADTEEGSFVKLDNSNEIWFLYPTDEDEILDGNLSISSVPYERSKIKAISSTDHGETWSKPFTIRESKGNVDVSAIIKDDGHLYMTYGNRFIGDATKQYWFEDHPSRISGQSIRDCANDSTSNDNDIFAEYSAPVYSQPGKIYKSVHFDGTDDYFKVSKQFSLDSGQSYTAMLWCNLDVIGKAATADYRMAMLSCAEDYPISIAWRSSSTINNAFQTYTHPNAGGSIHCESETHPVPGTWYHLTSKADFSNKVMTLHVNGIKESTSAVWADCMEWYNSGLHIGTYRTADDRWFDGYLEEVWIVSGAKSNAWIKTNYNFQSGQYACYDIGEEQEDTPEAPIPHRPYNYDMAIYYNTLVGDDFLDCRCSRWDVSGYSVIIETWLSPSGVNTLRNYIVPGAVGELYKILGKPLYYDKTWTGDNTLRILPTPSSNKMNKSTLRNLRDEVLIYPKNITTNPINENWIGVKIEGNISGNVNL